MSAPGWGLVKTTLLDYPGLVAAVLFGAGCNLRCPWCQNPGLVVPPWDSDLLTDAQALAFLERRRSVLGGVVVTGGEPLVRPDLPKILAGIRALGLKAKLDTNGTWPDRLANLAPGKVDYVAMDLKNAPSAYARSVGVVVPAERLRASISFLEDQFAQAAELRLTWVPGLNDLATLDEYAGFAGTTLPVWVQAYRPGPVLDPAAAGTRAPTPAELDAVVSGLRERGVDARLRG